jgi:hypothetical protein
MLRILILIFSTLYFIFLLLFFKADNDQFNSILNAIGSVVILVLSLSYFMYIMKPTTEPVNIFTPVFLIVIALLLYVASTLFLFIIAGRLSQEEMKHYWIILSLTNILVSLIFSTAFLLVRFQKKSSPPENRIVDFTSPNDR